MGQVLTLQSLISGSRSVVVPVAMLLSGKKRG
jgi:hypothetical protein